MHEGTRVDELAKAAGGYVLGHDASRVTDVRHDSRDVGPGELFVAVRGFTEDGHRHVPAAVSAGAAAVCVEAPLEAIDVAQIVVPDPRRAMPVLAATVHGHPSLSLQVVGVTGTNGKTTVTHLLEAIATCAGLRAGVVGTLGARIAGRDVVLARTTPESTDLQRLLAKMVAEEVSIVAVEVSSHALALDRVAEIHFKVGAFTNLSQDHLDFHGDMDAYFAAKASLFGADRCETPVVWVDDPRGEELEAELAGRDTVRVGMGAGRDIWADSLVLGLDGSTFEMHTPVGSVPVRLLIPGRFNIANAMIAAACAVVLDVPLDAVAAGLASVDRIPGRFEAVSSAGPVVIVDYAHTPAGVEAVIATVRDMTRGRVIVVVGAGGDRDHDKRPLMGRAAATADVAVITSDNPRSEDPAAIITDVMAGITDPTRAVAEVDRRRAIDLAVDAAGVGDVVLVLGKGHEQRQELNGSVVAFDDRTVVEEALGTWSP